MKLFYVFVTFLTEYFFFEAWRFLESTDIRNGSWARYYLGQSVPRCTGENSINDSRFREADVVRSEICDSVAREPENENPFLHERQSKVGFEIVLTGRRIWPYRKPIEQYTFFRYIDHVIEKLRQHKTLADKALQKAKAMELKREEVIGEQCKLEPQVPLLLQQTKELQKLVSQIDLIRINLNRH